MDREPEGEAAILRRPPEPKKPEPKKPEPKKPEPAEGEQVPEGAERQGGNEGGGGKDAAATHELLQKWKSEREEEREGDGSPIAVVYIDTGKALPGVNPGNEDAFYDGEDDEDGDDGTSFLEAVPVMSPKVKVVSQSVQVVSKDAEPDGEEKERRPIRRTSLISATPQRRSSLTIFEGEVAPVRAHTTDAGLANALEGNSSSGSFRYGSGSQNYQKDLLRSRALSFADETGRDLAQVNEVVNTHYKLKRGFFRRIMSVLGRLLLS